MSIRAIREALALSGRNAFGPYHYAMAKKLDWHMAREVLIKYVEEGVLIRMRNGQFKVNKQR